MAKIYRVGLVFEFDPEGDHADLFEGKDEEQMILSMKSLVSEDIVRLVKYNEEYESLQVEVVEQQTTTNQNPLRKRGVYSIIEKIKTLCVKKQIPLENSYVLFGKSKCQGCVLRFKTRSDCLLENVRGVWYSEIGGR